MHELGLGLVPAGVHHIVKNRNTIVLVGGECGRFAVSCQHRPWQPAGISTSINPLAGVLNSCLELWALVEL